MIVPVIIIMLAVMGIIYNLYQYRNPSKTYCDHHYRILRKKIMYEDVDGNEILRFYELYKPLVPHDYLSRRFRHLIKLMNQYHYVGSLQ